MRRMFSKLQLIALIIKTMGENIVNALLGKDINVEGITSKGIANTGGFANIGDVAISGNLNVQGEGKGIITCNELKEELDTELIDLSSYIISSFAKSGTLYAKMQVKHNILNVVLSGKFVAGTSSGTNPDIISNFGALIPSEIKELIYRADGTKISEAPSSSSVIDRIVAIRPVSKDVAGNFSANSTAMLESSGNGTLSLRGFGFGTIAEDAEVAIDIRFSLLLK